MDSRPIGMFDSGVGGITVLSEVIKKIRNEDIIYIGDTLKFPYGVKSKESIIKLSKQNIDILIEKGVKAVVIACGTATSQALEELRTIYKIPIIGIIEPTVEAIKKENKKQKIGVIGTEGTIRSNAWEKELKKNINNIDVISRACPLLAPMAEEGWIENKVAEYTVKEYLEPFKKENLDKLILGCTHYYLYKKFITQELGENVEIIDTGKKLSTYLKEIIEKTGLNNEENHIGNYKIYLTDTECKFIKIANSLLQSNNNIILNDIEQL